MTRSKTTWMTLAVVALTLLAAGAARAASRPEWTLAGTISAVDAQAATLTLTTEHGTTQTFATGSELTVKEDRSKWIAPKKRLAVGDLKTGEKVAVTFYLDGDRKVATRIDVAAPAERAS